MMVADRVRRHRVRFGLQQDEPCYMEHPASDAVPNEHDWELV